MLVDSASVCSGTKNSSFPSATLSVDLESARQDTVPVHLPSYTGFLFPAGISSGFRGLLCSAYLPWVIRVISIVKKI